MFSWHDTVEGQVGSHNESIENKDKTMNKTEIKELAEEVKKYIATDEFRNEMLASAHVVKLDLKRIQDFVREGERELVMKVQGNDLRITRLAGGKFRVRSLDSTEVGPGGKLLESMKAADAELDGLRSQSDLSAHALDFMTKDNKEDELAIVMRGRKYPLTGMEFHQLWRMVTGCGELELAISDASVSAPTMC